MSPSFRWKRSDGSTVVDYVSSVRKGSLPEQELVLYIDNGGVGLEKNLQPGIDAMLQALREKGMSDGKQFHWVLASEDRHHEAEWAKRLPRALEILSHASGSTADDE